MNEGIEPLQGAGGVHIAVVGEALEKPSLIADLGGDQLGCKRKGSLGVQSGLVLKNAGGGMMRSWGERSAKAAGAVVVHVDDGDVTVHEGGKGGAGKGHTGGDDEAVEVAEGKLP